MRFLTKTEMCEMWTEEDNTILADMAFSFLKRQTRLRAKDKKRSRMSEKDADALWIQSLNL